MQAIEMVHPDGLDPDAAIAGRLLDEAKKRGLLRRQGWLVWQCHSYGTDVDHQ